MRSHLRSNSGKNVHNCFKSPFKNKNNVFKRYILVIFLKIRKYVLTTFNYNKKFSISLAKNNPIHKRKLQCTAKSRWNTTRNQYKTGLGLSDKHNDNFQTLSDHPLQLIVPGPTLVGGGGPWNTVCRHISATMEHIGLILKIWPYNKVISLTTQWNLFIVAP